MIGLAVAWRAAQAGMCVTLIERGELGAGTSAVAAGMIAPIAEADPLERPLLRLAMRSAELYPEFARALADQSGRDPGYLACGTLLAARDRDEAEALDRELEMRERLGLPVRRLLPSEARSLEPALAPALRLALEIPDDQSVDPRMLTAALGGALTRAGGETLTGAEVSSVAVSDGRVVGVRFAGGERLATENVVIAAGVWSGRIGGIHEELQVPLHPVKGQILHLHDPSGPGLLSRVLRMERCYVVPRGDGRYALGATVEERGFDTTVTAGAVWELLRDATELVPGVAELVIDELLVGLRPGTPDGAPAIGPSELPGLHWATGHYRHGILLAPVTAELVLDGLRGAPVPGEFSPGRFRSQVAVPA